MTANQQSETNPLLESILDKPQAWNMEDLEEFDSSLPAHEAVLSLIKRNPYLLTTKKRPDLYTVADSERETSRAKRLAVLEVIAFKVGWGKRKLPDHILEDVAKEFEVTVRQVQRWINNYMAYRYKYPQSPGAEVFLSLTPGPEQKQEFTDDQIKILLYAIAERSRLLRSAIGKTRRQEIPFAILDIYRFAKSVFDRAGIPFPAYSTVVKFISRLKEREPELFTYMQLGPKQGRRFVEENFLPKRRNDVSGPNKRWQTDVKEAQVYVEHNGERYTFAILAIYDDSSEYIVYWKLFLKEAKADGSGTKGVTTHDWSTAAATAMYHANCRPDRFYYDNGTYYIAADGSLQQLTEDEDSETKTTKSKPGRPEGRGKIENFFKQLVSMLNRMAGRYEDRAGITGAKRDPDPYSFAEAEAEFEKKMGEWNKTPHRKNGKKTRFEIWSEEMALKAPPIRKLAQLRDIEFENKPIAFRRDYNWALQFKGKEWEPRLINADINRLWARAVAGLTMVPMWAVKLDFGWVAEVCLDEQAEIWVEIIEKGSQPHDPGELNEGYNRTLKDIEIQRKALVQVGEEALLRLGGVPVGAVSSGEYVDVLPNGSLPKPSPEPSGTKQSNAEELSGRSAEIEDLGAVEGAAEENKESSGPNYNDLYQRLKARLREKE